ILSALEFVADHGEAFLPLYELGWRDGVWTPRGIAAAPPPFEISLASMRAERADEKPVTDAELARERARYLDEARRRADELRKAHGALPPTPPTGDPALDRLIWFRYVHSGPVPSEAEAAHSVPPLASE